MTEGVTTQFVTMSSVQQDDYDRLIRMLRQLKAKYGNVAEDMVISAHIATGDDDTAMNTSIKLRELESHDSRDLQALCSGLDGRFIRVFIDYTHLLQALD